MKRQTLISGLIAVILLGGCTTTNPYTRETETSKAVKGAGIGALVGAVGGLIVGDDGKKEKAALRGAALGAVAGGGIGYYMDVQEAKLRQQLEQTGVSVSRRGNNIVLNMPSNITFDVDQFSIKPGFDRVLNSVALVLKEYDQTRIDVVGYTDSTGSSAYNNGLSERRASSVANYLYSQGVDGRRFQIFGAGESNPIASNSTESGRALNRRVEITLQPAG